METMQAIYSSYRTQVHAAEQQMDRPSPPRLQQSGGEARQRLALVAWSMPPRVASGTNADEMVV